MPPKGVKKGSKRDRQYKKIVKSEKKEGRSTKRAKEIAARTVNKEKARSGESKSKSKSSTRGRSASSRGGKQSGKGPSDKTKEQLYNDAKRLNIEGRSKMTKKELQRAVSRKS
ncbi:MAG: plasmid stabilization protein [Solirubrobacterales bacterium]